MNHYNKPPLTIEQHINQLEKRGLIITDSVVAEQYLTNNDPHAFMNTELFNDPWKHQRQLTKVTNELKDSNEVFINHYKKHYTQPFLPPIWAMVETITFGSLSQWYSNTKNNKLKAKIAKSLGMPTVEVMQGALHSLTLIRNLCAQHSRLWNRRFTMQLPAIRKLKQQMRTEKIATKSAEIQEQPRRELFNYIIVISHMMLKIQPDSSWTSRLLSHINSLDENQQWMMGFSPDWQVSDFID